MGGRRRYRMSSGPWRVTGGLRLKICDKVRQDLLLKSVPNRQGVARLAEAKPGRSQFKAELFLHLIPQSIRQWTGPNRLDAQRRFAPTFDDLAVVANNAQTNTRASHRSYRLG